MPTSSNRPSTGRLEEQAFEALYTKHCAFVQGFVARLLGPRHDPRDLTQEIFILALAKRGVDLENPRAWLASTAVRVVANFRRAAWIREKFTLNHKPAEEETLDCHTPEDAFRDLQAHRRLYSVLDKMPTKLRTVLILVELQESTPAEAAKELGVPVKTVYSRLSSAQLEFHRRFRQMEALHA